MSTTASALRVADDLAVISHVGDSRVYHAHGDAVRQLTEDHTLQSMRMQQGLAPEAGPRVQEPERPLRGRTALRSLTYWG